jgi:hypothetical protein
MRRWAPAVVAVLLRMVLSLIVVPFLYASVRFYVIHIQSRLEKVRAMEGEPPFRWCSKPELIR